MAPGVRMWSRTLPSRRIRPRRAGSNPPRADGIDEKTGSCRGFLLPSVGPRTLVPLVKESLAPGRFPEDLITGP